MVCMIYYPDENNTPSWANGALGALGYNTNPEKIQLLLRKFFEEATRYVPFAMSFSHLVIEYFPMLSIAFDWGNASQNSNIRIRGSEVIPIPLFRALDGTKGEDYVARVEPSASGGRKMAEYLLDAIHGKNDNISGAGMASVSAPSASFIDRRAT